MLNNKRPAAIFYTELDFIPKDVQVFTPYQKEGELRMKFTGRYGQAVQIAMPLIPILSPTTNDTSQA